MASKAIHLALFAGVCAGYACSDLTRPPPHELVAGALEPSLPAAPGASAPAAPNAAPTALVGQRVAPDDERIAAAHILVAYRGATRAKPTVTRTKEEARALATRLVEQARQPGVDFAKLARDVSDAPSGIEGGVLPKFGRQQMVKPFSDAAFALRPGQISDVVETNFGFHIIRRTE
jgi:hypothetical protein